MKKLIRIFAFIVLFTFVFYGAAPVNLAKSVDNNIDYQTTKSFKSRPNQEEKRIVEIETNQPVKEKEEEYISESKETQTITGSTMGTKVENAAETKAEERLTESELEKVSTEIETESELEEAPTEVEIESATESELEEIPTEIETESATESELEEVSTEVETESATESELEETSTETEPEEGELLIDKVILSGDYNWNDSQNYYYTKQDSLELEVSIIKEFNSTKEIAIQIGDNVLSPYDNEKDTYVGEIALAEGWNQIVVSLMLEGREEDRRQLTILQDCTSPVITKVNKEEVNDNKIYQSRIIKTGELLVLEIDKKEQQASGIKEVKILDCDGKEIGFRASINANKIRCTFTESLANTMLEAFVIDNAGNVSDKLMIFLDTELPDYQITHFVLENMQRRELYKETMEKDICRIYTNRDQLSVELKAQDKISGIATVEAEIDGVFMRPIIITNGEGETVSYQFDFEVSKFKEMIIYRVTDLAGNYTETVYEVLFDQTAPKWQLEENEIETIQNKTFQIPICADESGIWKAYIEREGKKYSLIASDMRYGYTFSEEEIDKNTEKVAYTLHLIDKAGNIFTESFYLLFDFTAPQIELSVYGDHEASENPISCERFGTTERYYTNTDCKLIVAVTDETSDGCSSGEIALTLLTEERNGTRHKENLKLLNGVCEIAAIFSGKEYDSNVYTLQACDAIGNRSEYTFEMIYDPVSPIITIIELEGGAEKKYQNKRQLSLSIEEVNFSKKNFTLLPIGSQKEGEIPKMGDWRTEGTKHNTTLTFSNDGVYCFQIVCTDKAGNKSIYKVDKLVIDTIAPEVTISYEKGEREQAIHYNQMAIITVTDKNFDVMQNHELFVIPESKKPIISRWKKTEKTDQYSCTVHFAEDGAYHFRCAYRDKAGNISNMVVSDTLVIDHTLPLIHASYMDKKSKTGINLNTSGVLHIEITEENFSREAVAVILHNQKSAKKTTLKVSWLETEEHIFKAAYHIQEDGMYSLTVMCKDKAGNGAETYQSDIFLVDRNKPVVDICYEGTKRTDDCYKGSRTAKITVRDVSFNENCTTNFYIMPKNVPVKISAWTKKSIEYTNEYEYTCTVKFEQDGAYSFQFSCADQVGNLSELVEGGRFIIDNTAPVIQIDFEQTDTRNGINYHRTKTAVIKIIEQNFVKENVLIEPVRVKIANVVLKENQFPTVKEWVSNGDIHSAIINFAQDGIYGFRIICKDRAGNEKTMEFDSKKLCIIDTTAPSVKITYDKDTKNDRQYNTSRTAKVIVTDANFDEGCTANFNFGTGSIKPRIGKWRQEGTDYICEVFFEKDGVYHFQFSCEDKAGNLSKTIDGGSFVIDTTAPEISVTFDNNRVKNGNYYNASRTATITIIENAFSDQFVQIEALGMLEVDNLPAISRWKTDGERHTATINFTKEGVYGFQVACKDLAGNPAKEYVSALFVIDKTAPQITFDGVCANSANNGVVMPIVNYTDSFLDEAATTVTLTGTNHRDQTANAQKSVITDGIRLVYPDFAHVKEMDDVYRLKVKAVDLAGNEKEETLNFSVNRFGSTYQISADTQQLIEDYYTSKAPVITVKEVNIDVLEYGEVTISREGQTSTLVRGENYIVTQEGADADWNAYTYKIKADNFSSDGIYSVGFYSVDKAKNMSDNRVKGKEIEFVLDTTAPSIVVDGMKSGETYREQKKKVTLDVKDNLYLTELQVTDNGETILRLSEKELSENNGIVTFLLQEKEAEREIVIMAKDRAKNEQIQKFYGVLISSKKEVFQGTAKKKLQNKKAMTDKSIEINKMTEAVEYTDSLTVLTCEKENRLLYGVSTVMFIAVLTTAGIVQVRKRQQKEAQKSGGNNA